jgi:hypothetical protein
MANSLPIHGMTPALTWCVREHDPVLGDHSRPNAQVQGSVLLPLRFALVEHLLATNEVAADA